MPKSSKKTLDKEAKKLQARAGIQGEQQADLQLYQGNKEGFQNSPLKSYKAAYDVDKNKDYSFKYSLKSFCTSSPAALIDLLK